MGHGKRTTRQSVVWRVVITPTALKLLKNITDNRVREKIIHAIDRLTVDPEKQGKPLTGELFGFRSIRAVGQRYRIIFTMRQKEVVVVIVAVGIRKEGDKSDIYALAKKLIHLRLLEP